MNVRKLQKHTETTLRVEYVENKSLNAQKHAKEHAEWKRVVSDQKNKNPYHGLYFRD